MGLETGTFISDLNANNPVGATDPVSQGDDHLRLIKATLLNTFPNVTGEVTATQEQLNSIGTTGVFSDIENTFTASQIIAKNGGRFLRLSETDAADPDDIRWDINVDDSIFRLNLINDAGTLGPAALAISRTGVNVDTFNLLGDLVQANGSEIVTQSNADSLVNHDDLLGFVANEHINHASVSINAGDGLSGGGNITSSRTLNVQDGDGINVSGLGISVDSTVVRTSGTQSISGAKSFSTSLTVAGSFITSETISSADNGNIENFNTGTANIIRFTSATSSELRGLDGGVNGRRLVIFNTSGADNFDVRVESGSSTASNRIIGPNVAGLFTLRQDTGMEVIYDGISNRWRVIAMFGNT